MKSVLDGLKKVCFISAGADKWDGFGIAYDHLWDVKDCKITIIDICSYAAADIPEDLDAIFIQEPEIAGYGYVNGYPEALRAKNLAKGKALLIYMPYFLLAEPDPDNEASLAFIRELVLSPAVLNADMIFLQSENMKRAYVSILSENTDTDLSEWDQKIKVCDTLKYRADKLSEAKGGELRSAGKTIAYELLPGSFIAYEDRIIPKIKETLEVFENNSDSVRLRWIIHPDMEKLKGNISPEIYAEYENILKESADKEWITIDRSTDGFGQAALSDAFYGDMCEDTYIFQLLKKPIMVQNCEIRS